MNFTCKKYYYCYFALPEEIFLAHKIGLLCENYWTFSPNGWRKCVSVLILLQGGDK